MVAATWLRRRAPETASFSRGRTYHREALRRRAV